MPYRVAIVGGGMVGLAFANALASHCPDALDIVLLEARQLPTGDPDPMDTRASALNLASEKILGVQDCWDDLADAAAPITSIHVSNQHRFGSSLMTASEIGVSALGYVCENHFIGRALKRRADDLGIEFRAPVTVRGLLTGETQKPALQVDSDEVLEADLIIIADGVESGLRKALGVEVDRRKTGQTAIVANVVFGGAQQGTAFERFTTHGPMAMLPLPTLKSGQQRFNMVWCLPDAQAEAVFAHDDEATIDGVQREFGWRLGRVLKVGRKSLWPLARTRSKEQRRPGVLLAGNAAHGIHPVAGQGFNLSLRDASTFALAVKAGLSKGLSPGSSDVLADYENRVRDDQDRIVGSTDLLSTLFDQRGLLLDLPRDAALAALDLIPPLRRAIAEMGTGLNTQLVDEVHS